MICQRHCDAVPQWLNRERIIRWDRNLTRADEGEVVAVLLTPFIDECGLAMHENTDAATRIGVPAEADGCAALAGLCRVGRLPPF